MKDDLKDEVAAFFRREIDANCAPPFPGAEALRVRSTIGRARAAPRRLGSRSLPQDLLGMAGAACLLVFCLSVPVSRPAAVPARGAEALFNDRSVRQDVTRVLFAVARKLGESVRKE